MPSHDTLYGNPFWRAFSERANSELKYAGSHVPDHRCVIHLDIHTRSHWSMPREVFDLLCARQGRKRSYVVQRTRWEWEVDARRFENPKQLALDLEPRHEPTLTWERFAMSTRAGAAIERTLAALRIPVVLRNPDWGYDGWVLEATIGDTNTGCRLWWWGDAPDDWRELGEVAQQVLRVAGREHAISAE